MKYTFLFVACCIPLLGISQITAGDWYVWTFDMEQEQPTTKEITYLNLSDMAEVPDFHDIEKGKFVYNKNLKSESGSAIGYIIPVEKRKGTWMTSSKYAIRQLVIRPGTDDHTFVVRAKKDILCLQKNNGYQFLLTAKRIRSFTWVNTFHIAVVISGEDGKRKCLLLNIRDMKKTTVSNEVGHSVAAIDDSSFSFIDIFSDEYRYIKSYDINSEKSEIIVRVPSDIETFDSPDGQRYYIGDNSQIKQFVRGRDADWDVFADFSPYGIEHINALCTGRENIFLIQNEK